MLFDANKQKDVTGTGIPKRASSEWKRYTSGISDIESQGIVDWINDKFEEIAARRVPVQPAGWLGSGFDWSISPLMPIYRECAAKMIKSDDDEIKAKAGQIFGLFVSKTLTDRKDIKWYFVKGEEYMAHGVPIRSRIYFLPVE